MESLFANYNLDKFEIKKPRKDDERREYIERLHELTGWSKRGLVFSFAKLPTEWLHDAIMHCQFYENQSTRGYKLKEFIKEMKK